MKTIEQLLKPVIKGDLQALLTSAGVEGDTYTLKLTNDFRHEEPSDDRFTIAGLIRTGDGTRTSVPGINALQSTIQIVLRVDVNYTQKLLSILNQFCRLTNANKYTVTDEQPEDPLAEILTYEYSINWNVPIPSGTQSDVVVKSNEPGIKSETISVEHVIVTGTLTYSDSLKLDDEEVFFKINVPMLIQEWIDSDEAYWNSMSEDMRGTAEGTTPPAENYADGFAMRIFYDGWGYEYIKKRTRNTTALTYTKLLGITASAEDLTPSIETVNLIEEERMEINIIGDAQSMSIAVVRIPGDYVHDWLLRKMYEVRSETSFDAVMKHVVHSLDIEQSDIDVIISNVKKIKQAGFEYISFSLTRK